jgi:hypothetical protein
MLMSDRTFVAVLVVVLAIVVAVAVVLGGAIRAVLP